MSGAAGAPAPAPEPELVPWPKALTRRERQIAAMICACQTRGQIAELLNITRATVDSHRRTMLEKLGVRNEVELVRKAIAQRWVRGDAAE